MSNLDIEKDQAGKAMDSEKAGRNLLAAAEILDSLDLSWYLAFGTLLGAIREGSFIVHDSDTDVGVFGDFVERFDEVAEAMRARGFEILKRDEKRGVYAFSRDGEYIDFYHSRPSRDALLRPVWDVESSFFPQASLETLDAVEFLGRRMPVPSNPERVLRLLYGRHWRTPVRNFPGRMSLSNRLKRFLSQRDKLAALGRHLRIQKAARRGCGGSGS